MESVIATASASTSYGWVIPLLVGFVLIAVAFCIFMLSNKISGWIAGIMAIIWLLTSAVGAPCHAVFKDIPTTEMSNDNARSYLIDRQSEFESQSFQMREYAQKDLGGGSVEGHFGLFGGGIFGIYTTDQCLAVIYEIPDKPGVYRAFRLNLEKTEIRSSGNQSPYFLLDTNIEKYCPCKDEDGSWIDDCKNNGKTNYRLVLSGYSYLYLPDGWEIY